MDINPPNPYATDNDDLRGLDRMPRPLISWGISMATLSSLKKNIEADRNFLAVDKINIGIADADVISALPAIILDIRNIKNMRSGFTSNDLTDPREMVLFSTGSIDIQIIARRLPEMWTLRDYITQLFLMYELYEEPFFLPGEQRSYVGLSYKPGAIEWSPPSEEENYEAGRDEAHVVSKTTIEFHATHRLAYDLVRMTGIDIEAIPLSYQL